MLLVFIEARNSKTEKFGSDLRPCNPPPPLPSPCFKIINQEATHPGPQGKVSQDSLLTPRAVRLLIFNLQERSSRESPGRLLELKEDNDVKGSFCLHGHHEVLDETGSLIIVVMTS